MTITPAQLGYLLEGIDWRMPQQHVASSRRRVDRGYLIRSAALRLTSDSFCDSCRVMALAVDSLPTDLAAAHAMIVAKHEALLAAEARASAAESEAKHRALLIEKLKFTIAKLRHEQFGQSSERGALLEQLELAACRAGGGRRASRGRRRRCAAAEAKVAVRSFERRRPARRPLPEHLPRERIVYPAPAACPCCGGAICARSART